MSATDQAQNKLQDWSVSLIIVNHNSGDRLVQCVRSVFAANADLEVIVVDNATTDSSLAQLEAAFPADPRLRIIRHRDNLGFSVACNRGADFAQGQYLLYLNPDCLIETNTISELVTTLEQDSTIGMGGGLLLNPEGTEQAGGRRLVPTPWRTFVRVFKLRRLARRYPHLFSDFNLHLRPLPDRPVEVEAISGACMLVRREALQDIGGLDEDYFLHCEDLDWCMRFRQKDWKIVFVPGARVIHFAGTCGHKRPVFVEWHKHKGMVRFYCKFFRHQYPGPVMWLILTGVWSRFGLLAGYYTVRRLGQYLRPARG